MIHNFIHLRTEKHSLIIMEGHSHQSIGVVFDRHHHHWRIQQSELLWVQRQALTQTPHIVRYNQTDFYLLEGYTSAKLTAVGRSEEGEGEEREEGEGEEREGEGGVISSRRVRGRSRSS